MAYKKFDDASAKVSQAQFSVYAALKDEAIRRVFQTFVNRVIAGTTGTGNYPGVTAVVAKAGTAGVKTTTQVLAVINGVVNVIPALDNMQLPSGTQGKNTVAKYLVVSYGTSGTYGTAGTIVGPGNVISKADYATVALANAACKLPDPPEHTVVLGYVQVNAPTLTDIVFADDSALDTTGGTAVYGDLMCLPYDN
jgi:hypothetical protein